MPPGIVLDPDGTPIMAKAIANLELRHGGYHYRVTFSLNRKTLTILLSLETADLRVARGDQMVAGFREQAAEALRVRNLDANQVNQAVATRQITVGTLLALRAAMSMASDPGAALDAMLACTVITSRARTSWRHRLPSPQSERDAHRLESLSM